MLVDKYDRSDINDSSKRDLPMNEDSNLPKIPSDEFITIEELAQQLKISTPHAPACRAAQGTAGDPDRTPMALQARMGH